jgi:hypothetical protein
MAEDVSTIIANDLRQRQNEDIVDYISRLLGINVVHLDAYQVLEKLSEMGISVILAVKDGEGMPMCAEFWKGEALIGSLDIFNHIDV